MLQVCDIFAVEYDVKFNTVKSVAMRIGPRFNVTCAPLMLDGMYLKYVESVKYLFLKKPSFFPALFYT